MARISLEKNGGSALTVKNHADHLMKSAVDAVYYVAKRRIMWRWRSGELTREQAKEELEMLQHDLEVEP